MGGVAIEWVAGGLASVLTGWIGYLFGLRQERERERRARISTAAPELVSPLRELQRLIRRFGREDVATDEVVVAFMAWASAYDEYGHRLPERWQHVARSVRDAAGTVFGGVSLIHLLPDSGRLDLGEPDETWQDFGDDYIEYVARRILIWGDSSNEAPKELMTYDSWLKRTGRWGLGDVRSHGQRPVSQ